jgi:hypothetical protein
VDDGYMQRAKEERNDHKKTVTHTHTHTHTHIHTSRNRGSVVVNYFLRDEI